MSLTPIVVVVFLICIGYIIFYIYSTISAISKIAKKSNILEPKVLSKCPDGSEMKDGLCYPGCKRGYKRVVTMCVPDVYGVGVGTIPGRKGCDPGQRDDGTSCWDDLKCNTGYFGGRLIGALGEDWGPKLETKCSGKGGIVKTAFDRYDCGDGHESGGLCYKKCPEGMEHIPAEPWHCRVKGVGASYDTGVGGIPDCPPGQRKDGALCYDDPGPDKKVVGGVAYDNCPEGSKDIGLFCVPGGGTTPWYLSIYIFIAAWILSGVCVLYFRYGMKADIAMSSASGGLGMFAGMFGNKGSSGAPAAKRRF